MHLCPWHFTYAPRLLVGCCLHCSIFLSPTGEKAPSLRSSMRQPTECETKCFVYNGNRDNSLAEDTRELWVFLELCHFSAWGVEGDFQEKRNRTIPHFQR